MSTDVAPGHRQHLRSAVVRIAVQVTLRPLLARLAPRGIPLVLLRAIVGGTARLVAGARRPRVLRVAAPVPGEWVLSDTATDTDGAVLYLHGGGYVAGSPRASRCVTAGLANRTGLPVFAPAYRRAPEHTFPAAIDDCVTAFHTLVAGGIPAERIVVAGDSAGAHLAAGLVVQLLQDDQRPPAGLALFSPLFEPDSALAAERDLASPDPMTTPGFAQRCARSYVGNAPATDPRIRILSSDDHLLSAFPPVLSLCGSTECFRDDARRLHERLTRLGRRSAVLTIPGQVHGFVALHRILAPSGHAMRQAAIFLRQCLDTTPVAGPTRPHNGDR